MELVHVFSMIARRRWVVIITAFFAVIITALVASEMPVSYSASTVLRVLTTKVGGSDYAYYDVAYSSRLTKTFASIAVSAPVTEELKNYVNRMPKTITATDVADTELIRITVEDTDPGLAQFVADKIAEILLRQSQLKYADSSSPISIYIVEPAVLPIKPSSLNPLVMVFLGLITGVVGGIGLAYIFEGIDSRLYAARDIEGLTNLPVLGNIPKVNTKFANVGLFASQLQIEAFRRLRTNFFTPANKDSMRTILVTSSVREDGKSTIVANLSLSIAQTDKKVVVIDANLRQPVMHQLFGLANNKGLVDLLNDDAELEEVLQYSDYPGVSVITSGRRSLNPVEILSSAKMDSVLEALKERFDVVLIDSSPSLTVTDPAVLAPKCDAVVLVVRMGWVRREALQATQKQLMSVNANLLGVIVNLTDLGRKSQFSKMNIRPKNESPAVKEESQKALTEDSTAIEEAETISVKELD